MFKLNLNEDEKPYSYKFTIIFFSVVVLLITGGYCISEYKSRVKKERQQESYRFTSAKSALEMKILLHSQKFKDSSEEYKKLKQYEREVDYCKDKEELHELERKALTL